MKEIFKLVSNLNYTQNKNGIFLNMKQLDETMIKKIEDLDFHLKMINRIQKNLEDLILKDVYQITGCSLEKSKRLDLFMGY